MRLSQYLEHIPNEDYSPKKYPSVLWIDLPNKNRLIFISNVVNIKFIEYYIMLTGKLHDIKPEDITVDTIYDIKIKYVPDIETQNELVEAIRIVYKNTIIKNKSLCQELTNISKGNLSEINPQNTAKYNVLSLITIKDECLFRENLLNCNFDDSSMVVNDPKLVRAEYIFYYIYFLYVAGKEKFVDLNEITISLPELLVQDWTINIVKINNNIINEAIRKSKKWIRKLTELITAM